MLRLHDIHKNYLHIICSQIVWFGGSKSAGIEYHIYNELNIQLFVFYHENLPTKALDFPLLYIFWTGHV